MTQLTIPLNAQTSFAPEDYVLSESNQRAYDALMQPIWPDYGLWLHGPARAGKSHLVSIWAQAAGADATLMDPVPDLTDAQTAQRLFHTLNDVKAARGRILLVSEHSPAQTPCPLPDLASRIKALPTATLDAPDDALLRAVWFKRFSDKQLQVAPAVIDYLVARAERSFAATYEWADALDRAALAQKRAITIPLVKNLLPEAP
jgi:chromosomal replication initiation ATPase DnaA